MVEDEGFIDLIHVYEPRYQMPTRATLVDVELPKLYSQVKEQLESEIEKSTHVALTTDGWTSRSTQGCVTITCYFINRQCEFRNYTLQTRVLEDKHTGVNIGQVIRD